MPTYYFTYGHNHADEQGNSLGGCYTAITAGDWDEARAKMAEARGDKFATNYDSAEDAGVERWGLVERSLESVAFDKERMHRELVQRVLKAERTRLQRALEMLDKSEAILLKLPAAIVGKCQASGHQLDLDHLSREEVKVVLGALDAGKWNKSVNSSYDGTLDYTGTVDGLPVRLWAAGAPETCRVVEYEEVIPEQRVIKRKLICS